MNDNRAPRIVESRAAELLQLYGMSQREASVYLHVLRTGAASAGDIAKALQLRRMEAYRLVKKLNESDMLHSNAGKPVTYSARPIEAVMSAMLEEQDRKRKAMETAKEELVSISRSLPRGKTRPSEEQFRIIQGREQVYNKVSRMAENATNSLDLLLTRNDLVQAYQLGITEALNEAASRGVKVRVLSYIDESTAEAADVLQKRCELRHSAEAVSGRMVLADSSAALTSLVLDDSQGRRNDRDIAVSSESPSYAELMSSLFDFAYRVATGSRERLEAVREGKAVEGKVRSLTEVLQATLPEEGWEFKAPGLLMGSSGSSYDFAATVKKEKRSFGIDIVAVGKGQDARDRSIQSVMKKLDLPEDGIIVLSTQNPGDEVARLAKMIDVRLVWATDTLSAVTGVKRALDAS